MKDAEGADYIPHAPQNADHPGWYFHPAENAFYACTGNRDRGEKHACHRLRGTCDAEKGKWRWAVLVSDAPNSRYKSGGINFIDNP